MTGFGKPAKILEKLWPALQDGEMKAVHEARKLTRKAQAQLRIASAPKRTKRAWRDLRRAVAPVRDRDAAGQRLLAALQGLGVPRDALDRFQTEWEAVRRQTVAEVKWPDPPPAVKRPKHWRARVEEALRSDASELIREADQVIKTDHPERWHEWRKHLKRYRYTVQLTGKAPNALLGVLDQLGRMQDAQVIQDLLTREDWVPQYREALLQREAEAQREAQRRVRALWPDLREHLGARRRAGAA